MFFQLDIKKFYNIALSQRQELRYPPFSRLARILISGKNQHYVLSIASQLSKKLTINKESSTTIVIVTHDLLSIERINGNLLMLDDGHVLFKGSRDEALQSKDPKVYSFFHPGNTSDD
mgnify:CR=1 FL=1